MLPQGKGPRQASKLSNEILAFILQTMREEPELRVNEIPMRVEQQFGISVHLSSVERALARSRKKARPVPRCRTRQPHLQCGAGLSVWNDMKPCGAKRWRGKAVPAMLIWKWHSSNARGWQGG